MLKKLQNNPQKVLAQDRNEMMRLHVNSNKDIKIDVNSTFKSIWVTNALDGLEDYLVIDKIFVINDRLPNWNDCKATSKNRQRAY